MKRKLYPLFAITAAVALVACGDKPTPASQTSVSPPVSNAAPAPPASTPPAVPTPPPATGASPADTAKDTAATNPKGTLSAAEESKSMPMSGQAGSHSSTALDTKEAPKK